MIQNPQKIFGAKHAVEEFVNQQVDEEEASMVEAEEEFAITEKIKNGTISPAKNELHEAALKHITTQGIKSKKIQVNFHVFPFFFIYGI